MIGVVLLLLSSGIFAQKKHSDNIRTSHFPVMKEIFNTYIPGAPVLLTPKRIDGVEQEIRTDKHGLCYPALYDWNHDGKNDLLLGEFETGEKGSYIKVFLNEGSNKRPKYSGKFFYATDIKGDTITNYQWCCIGIHPRIVDLDGDGILDIVSGQYNPGLVSWWRGTKNGFMPRQFVPQEGYQEGQMLNDSYPSSDFHSNSYWNYTSVGFADYDGDGRIDMFVGGSGGLRVAKNIGLNGHPKFSFRKPLYYVDGTPLSGKGTIFDNGQGSWIFKTYMTPVDWDGDGILDLLITDEYICPGQNPIEFLKGVKTESGLRFEKPVPLFVAKDGSKVMPGCQPMIAVTDYNHDGIKDIVMGISIPTINGYEVADSVAWNWVRKMRIEMPGKDTGRVTETMGTKALIERFQKNPIEKSFYMGKLNDYKYLTLRHRGYVFVLLGTKNTKGLATQNITQVTDSKSESIENAQEDNQKVKIKLVLPDNVKVGETYTAEVLIDFAEGWHGYTNSKANEVGGFIPTIVDFKFPTSMKAVGEVIPSQDGTLYMGKVSFKQNFVCLAKTDEKIKAHISYQICNSSMCLPPAELDIEDRIK